MSSKPKSRAFVIVFISALTVIQYQ